MYRKLRTQILLHNYGITQVHLSYSEWLRKVQDNGFNLQYVPIELRDSTMCRAAIDNACVALRFTPNILLTQEICENIIDRNPFAIKYIPNQFYNENLVKHACRRNGKVLMVIPEICQTLEVIKAALFNCLSAKEYVCNKELLNKALNELGLTHSYIHSESGISNFEKSKLISLRRRNLSNSYVIRKQ